MLSVFKKEMKTYFSTPVGFVVMFFLMVFTGCYYVLSYHSGVADISVVLSSIITIVFFVVPILTMKLFADEKRIKTDQLLFTAPVSISSVVIGKFLAVMAYFGIYLFVIVVYNFMYYAFGGQPSLLVFLGNLIGFVLFTSTLVAIGIFISSLSENQVVSAIVSFSVSMFLILLDFVPSLFGNNIFTKVISWLSFTERYNSFNQGIFDISNTVFFLSLTATFLFLTVRVIDKKRWS